MTVVETKSFAVDWLLRGGKSVSEIGEKAADILNDVFDGIYHVQDIHRVSFAGAYVEVPISQPLATYDWDLLTRLVVLAHDRCVRVELKAEMRTGSYDGNPPVEYPPVEYPTIVVLFSKRERGGDWYHGHPTMEEAVERVRKRAPQTDGERR